MRTKDRNALVLSLIVIGALVAGAFLIFPGSMAALALVAGISLLILSRPRILRAWRRRRRFKKMEHGSHYIN